jgi:hypothetical protein
VSSECWDGASAAVKLAEGQCRTIQALEDSIGQLGAVQSTVGHFGLSRY